jgi:hypothetical protein
MSGGINWHFMWGGNRAFLESNFDSSRLSRRGRPVWPIDVNKMLRRENRISASLECKSQYGVRTLPCSRNTGRLSRQGVTPIHSTYKYSCNLCCFHRRISSPCVPNTSVAPYLHESSDWPPHQTCRASLPSRVLVTSPQITIMAWW